MQENIGYACMTETPCVIVDVQRSGPSTGQATLPAQGDDFFVGNIPLGRMGTPDDIADAAIDHAHTLFHGTPEGEWTSMAVTSDGSYGVPEGIISSFPCTCTDGRYEIVQGLDIDDYAAEMFAAKSDVSAFSDAELIRMDSKEYEVDGVKLRVSVLETTAPEIPLGRKDSLMETMKTVCAEDGVDEVTLFVVDILKEEATLLIPNDRVKGIAEKSFGATVDGDTVMVDGATVVTVMVVDA